MCMFKLSPAFSTHHLTLCRLKDEFLNHTYTCLQKKRDWPNTALYSGIIRKEYFYYKGLSFWQDKVYVYCVVWPLPLYPLFAEAWILKINFKKLKQRWRKMLHIEIRVKGFISLLINCKLYTVYFIQYTVYGIWYTICCIVYTLYILYTVYCIL